MNLINVEQQRALKELGFYTGPIDGRWGPKSEKAVRQFQTMHGLTVDGVIGPQTYKELFPRTIEERHTAQHRWPTEDEVPEFYGVPGASQVKVHVPWHLRLAWAPEKSVAFIGCHEKVAPSLEAILKDVNSEYTEAQKADLGIDLFGGCLNVRKKRGGNQWSMHSWGIAIDWDPARNRLQWNRTKARLAQPDAEAFWQCWEAQGWVSLGRAKNYDWMHVQAARP